MSWENELLDKLENNASQIDRGWISKIKTARKDNKTAIHLAIFAEPFLTLLLHGEKTIESRFSKNRHAPYLQIKSKDIVLVKKTGGPVIAIFEAEECIFMKDLHLKDFQFIEKAYGRKIGSQHDPRFWKNRNQARFATLVEVKNIVQFPEIECNKKDRRGWVVLKKTVLQNPIALTS